MGIARKAQGIKSKDTKREESNDNNLRGRSLSRLFDRSGRLLRELRILELHLEVLKELLRL